MSEQERSVVPGFVRGYRFWSTRARPIYDNQVDVEAFYVNPSSFAPVFASQVLEFEYDDYRLYGAWKSTEPWDPAGVTVATCVKRFNSHYIFRSDHQSPGWNCTCGLYAKHWPEPQAQRAHMIGGIIDAWGSTVLGTTGFRAERAIVRALWVGRYEDPHGANIIGEKYGVPVFDEAEQAVLEFPPTEVKELLGRDLDYDLLRAEVLLRFRERVIGLHEQHRHVRVKNLAGETIIDQQI